MARSFLSTGRYCALALAAASAVGAQEGREELEFTSGKLVLDRQSNMMRAESPLFTQGNLTIAADDALATAFEFDEAGELRLTGNVRVQIDSAVMRADSAVFTFARGQLTRGELAGAPVSFSDTDGERQVTGTAGTMSYDYAARTLRMMGEATVQLDRREVLGCDLIYDFGAERVTSGSADCQGGFRVRVRRDAEGEAAAPEPPQ